MKLKFMVIATLFLAACNNQNEIDYQDNEGDVIRPGGGYTNQAGGAFGNAGTNLAENANNIDYLNEEIGNTVLFIVDQSDLTATAKSILDRQAEWLKLANRSVLIEGHADEQGTREYNLALGARRAASVRDYLVIKGVPYSSIEVITYGKERPLAVCSEESCWSKNRRAVTVVR